MRTRPTRLVLVGGGHGHMEVLRRFALQRNAANGNVCTIAVGGARAGSVEMLLAMHHRLVFAAGDCATPSRRRNRPSGPDAGLE